MNPALRTAASGMAAQQTRTDVIAHNLANVNTTGFKRSEAQFKDLMYQTIRNAEVVDGADAVTLPSVQIGRGTALASVERLHEQGALEQTGNPTDIAIEGEGLLQVQLPSGGTAYTRAGALHISDQGVLTTGAGLLVLPGVRIPSDAGPITISRNGVVTTLRAGDPSGTPTELGRIELARFPNPSGLEAQGDSMYTQTPASGDPIIGAPGDDGFGNLQQGALEGSNVDVITEMVNMISSSRAYELNSKAVKTVDEMMQVANGMVR